MNLTGRDAAARLIMQHALQHAHQEAGSDVEVTTERAAYTSPGMRWPASTPARIALIAFMSSCVAIIGSILYLYR